MRWADAPPGRAGSVTIRSLTGEAGLRLPLSPASQLLANTCPFSYHYYRILLRIIGNR